MQVQQSDLTETPWRLEMAGMADLGDAYRRLGNAVQTAVAACDSGLYVEEHRAMVDEAAVAIEHYWDRLQRARQGYSALVAEAAIRKMYG